MRCAFFFSLVIVSYVSLLAKAQNTRSFAALEKRSGGRLGIMAMDTGSGRTLSYRGTARFPMCSTFKLVLVAQVLKRVDEGKDSLDRILPYGLTDLLEYAPITGKHISEHGMTIRDLCEAAITHSDNTAANLLLAALGGPEAFTRFTQALGDKVTRLDRNEPTLNDPVVGQTLDTTSPKAMLFTMQKVVLGDTLSPGSRNQLNRWLLANTTGSRRLKAGIPTAWRIGDKTGTGRDGVTNDIGILYPPGRPPILVTAYSSGSKASSEKREAVLAEVGRLVALWK